MLPFKLHSFRFILTASFICSFVTVTYLFEHEIFLENVKESEVSIKKRAHVCHQNPYVTSLLNNTDVVMNRVNQWHQQKSMHELKSFNVSLTGHEKFFSFEVMASCSDTQCIGGRCFDDTSKLVCGLEKLEKGCIIYSIGGNNLWSFELDLLNKTQCEIHTFDCTGAAERFRKPADARLHFHHVCLGVVHEGQPSICNRDEKCGET
jgi:hypothetical protein